jgi:hypothetical protein
LRETTINKQFRPCDVTAVVGRGNTTAESTTGSSTIDGQDRAWTAATR